MPIAAWRAPAQLLRASGLLGDFCGPLLGRGRPLNSEVVDRLLGSAWYSPAKIENELGWRAKVDLYNGVREMLDLEAHN